MTIFASALPALIGMVLPCDAVGVAACAPVAEVHQPAPAADDPFGQLAALETSDLREASGGTSSYSVDLSTIGLNISNMDGEIQDTTVTGNHSGGVNDTLVTDNRGITTVFINTGNAVVFQNSLQVNVYVPTGAE